MSLSWEDILKDYYHQISYYTIEKPIPEMVRLYCDLAISWYRVDKG